MPGHIMHLAKLMEEQVRSNPPPNRRPAAAADTAARPQHPGLYEKARDKALVTMEGLTIQHSAAQTFLGSQVTISF